MTEINVGTGRVGAQKLKATLNPAVEEDYVAPHQPSNLVLDTCKSTKNDQGGQLIFKYTHAKGYFRLGADFRVCLLNYGLCYGVHSFMEFRNTGVLNGRSKVTYSVRYSNL